MFKSSYFLFNNNLINKNLQYYFVQFLQLALAQGGGTTIYIERDGLSTLTVVVSKYQVILEMILMFILLNIYFT